IVRITFILLISSNILFAQQKPVVSKFNGFGTINFSDLAKKELATPPLTKHPIDKELKEKEQKGIPQNRVEPVNPKVTEINTPFVTDVSDEVETQIIPDIKSQTPVKSFSGLLDNDQVIPPDVAGAAGLSHLMETLNSQYRIFDKNGGTVSTLTLNSFW